MPLPGSTTVNVPKAFDNRAFVISSNDLTPVNGPVKASSYKDQTETSCSRSRCILISVTVIIVAVVIALGLGLGLGFGLHGNYTASFCRCKDVDNMYR